MLVTTIHSDGLSSDDEPVEMKIERGWSWYWHSLPSLTPERVARSAYFGFMLGRRVIVPGIFNNAMFVALRLLPHVLTVPIVSWLLRRDPKI